MAGDDYPTVTLIFPGHCVAADHPFATLRILLDCKNKVLNDGNILMDTNMNRAQFTNNDLGRFCPKSDPFLQPGSVNVDRALMSEAKKIFMNVLQEFIHTAINEVIPMVFKTVPHAMLLL